MSTVQKALPLPDIFYSGKTKDYFIENDRGLWITVNEGSLKRHLKKQGFISEVTKGEALSSLDDCLTGIQLQQDVHYAAPLAGYDSGIYDINNRRVLVTDSPCLIEPKEGEWPLLKVIFEGMFNDPLGDQRPYFDGWMKTAITALRKRKWQPGQVLALAGPIRSAKSLCQALITRMLGGRSAHPYQFMTGATTFNADLFAAEHLMIEDVAESTNITKRRHFAAQIKAFSVNREQHCHGKNQQPLTLTPLWRVTISLNDEAERLLVLPPVDEDIADKVMLLKVQKREMPMPTQTADEVEAFWNALVAELPAYLHHLEKWTIPENLRSPRFSIIHYHHPELLAALEALAPETQLLQMIDKELFSGSHPRTEPWTGLAVDLQDELTGDFSRCKAIAQPLLHSTVACGTYLSRLENKASERVSSRRVNGRTEYIIQPPLRK